VAGFFIVIAAGAVAIAAAIILTWAGFRNGDWTGEALARVLRADLEKGAAENRRVPPPRWRG
jgi:hypothetical protein